MTPMIWSASVMCADLLRLEDDIRSLEEAGCHELHFDIMDGLFVPNLALGIGLVEQARKVTSLPFDVHLMISKPEGYIQRFIDAGATSVCVHVEACTHAQRTLTQIRDGGASPGIALNPATPLTRLQYLLPYADRVLLMTVDPGYAGQRIISGAFERTKIVKENVAYLGNKTKIEVDGNITVKHAAQLANLGADIFVLGTASIFRDGAPGEQLRAFEEAVTAERKVQ